MDTHPRISGVSFEHHCLFIVFTLENSDAREVEISSRSRRINRNPSQLLGLKMSFSHDRMSHGGLSGRFCSALWSRAVTLITVC